MKLILHKDTLTANINTYNTIKSNIWTEKPLKKIIRRKYKCHTQIIIPITSKFKVRLATLTQIGASIITLSERNEGFSLPTEEYRLVQFVDVSLVIYMNIYYSV